MQRLGRLFLVVLLVSAAACSRDPIQQSNNLVENGNKFFAKEKYREASIMYRKALQKNAKNGEAYYRLGLTELKLGNPSQAVGALRRALDIRPNNTDAATKLADIYLLAYAADPQRGKPALTEIKQISDSLLKRDPKSFDGLRFAGYLALANNEPEQAIEKFEAAHQVKPDRPDLTLVLAQTLLRSNKAAEAEKLAKETLAAHKTYAPMYDLLIALYLNQNRANEAEQLLKAKVANNPKQEAFRLQLAAYYYETRRPQLMEQEISRLLSDQQDFPHAHLSVGRFFMRIHDLDRAKKEFEEGARANPKDKAVYQKNLVTLLAAQGKYSEATQLVAEVLKDNPKDDQAIALRSALQLQSGDPKQIRMAVTDLQSLVSKESRNADLRLQLGRALLANKQPDQALVQLEEAVKLRPDLIPARVMISQIYSNKGDHNRALQMADEVLKQAPGNLAARLLRTNSLFNLGQHERARQELEQIVKAAPNSVDARYQLAAMTFSERKYKEAAEAFERIRRDFPNDPRGFMGLVETDVAQNNFKAAMDMLNAELQKDPNRQDLQLALGNVMVRAQMYDDALRQYAALAAKSPNNADLQLRMAETYRLKGDLNSAIDYFRKATTLAPNDPIPAIRLAMLLDALGRHNEAKPLYEQVLRIQPDNGVALNNLAYIKAEEGQDLDQALAYAQRAKQRYPQEPNISDTLGWIYIKKNMPDDAIRIYQDLLKKDPNNATFRFHLAMALFQKGDRATAKREGQQALQTSQNKGEQAQIRELLTKIG
jgi:tetratricopeptide (TPR) repeat protein